MEEKKRQKEFNEEESTNKDESKKRSRTSKKQEETPRISFPLTDLPNVPVLSNQYIHNPSNYQANYQSNNPSNIPTNFPPSFHIQYSPFPQISGPKPQPIVSSSLPHSSQQEFNSVFFSTPFTGFQTPSNPFSYPNAPTIQFQLPQNLPATPQYNSPPPQPQIPRAQVQRFVIAEQPNEKQRKSYRGENRWITPHPLVIKLREVREEEGELSRILSGIVTVRLVDHDGSELSYERQTILESNDSLRQRLDSNNQAEFLLKVIDTSEDKGFRLLFTVSYILEGVGHVEEMMYSRPFLVLSNLKKTSISNSSSRSGASRGGKASGKLKKPNVDAMKPTFGPHHEETEVWIKGTNFEDVSVTFGDRDALVEETASNLIVAKSPIRSDLTSDTQVNVQVANKKGTSVLSADNNLQFTYEVRDKLQHLKDFTTTTTSLSNLNSSVEVNYASQSPQDTSRKSTSDINSVVEES